MTDNVDDIKEYYATGYDETIRLEQHQLEHDMTLRYLARYLPGQGRILEIGAAAGVYTIWLAQQGYHVTAVDMSENLLEECKRRVLSAGLQGNVTCIIADARDLSAVQERDFDAFLMMGPLYHLVLEEDRLLALQEATARLRSGGVCLSTLISRYGIMGDIIKNMPEWIEEKAEVRSIMETGRDPQDAHRGGFRGYFATVDEVAPLHEEVGLETLALVGIEPAISADDESYNCLQGTRRELWLDLLFELSREPALLAGSRHLLYVGRKPEQ
jgi:predicted O-methyltransferase YrrM